MANALYVKSLSCKHSIARPMSTLSLIALVLILAAAIARYVHNTPLRIIRWTRRSSITAESARKVLEPRTVEEGTSKATRLPCDPDIDEIHKHDLRHYKELYHKVQNIEDHPEILQQAYDELVNLCSETLYTAKLSPSSGILSLGNKSSRQALKDFLLQNNHRASEAWEKYLERRHAGGPREMFGELEEAKWWLKNSAVVKYVDGAWLGHTAKLTTPFNMRSISKNAWQVMSEEFGDGDLKKNHVYVYEKLMQEIGANLPAGWTKDFIHDKHNLNELQCWKAAVAQLLISLFPHEFFGEILGFNMAYEGLPLHLMKTTKELQELKLDPYYFVLHISIDNADSGHAAMAFEAVATYLDEVEQTEGAAKRLDAWRRVQAGFILAEGLPTNPVSPSRRCLEVKSQTELESSVSRIFQAKAPVAHKIHCSSRARIGRKSLVDWLEPIAFEGLQWQAEFLEALSSSKTWVCQGDSARSRFIRELSWNGRMYGAFTARETAVMAAWIDSMGQCHSRDFYQFINRERLDVTTLTRIFSSYPCMARSSRPLSNMYVDPSSKVPSEFNMTNVQALDVSRLIPLWFSSLALLQNFTNIPAKVSNVFASAIVKVVRAQMGFALEEEGVAGIDEIRKGQAIGLFEIGLGLSSELSSMNSLAEIMHDRDTAVAVQMLTMAREPWKNAGYIIGMSVAFAQLHKILSTTAIADFLSDTHGLILRDIADREMYGLELCLKECESQNIRWHDVQTGCSWMKCGIQKCFIRS